MYRTEIVNSKYTGIKFQFSARSIIDSIEIFLVIFALFSYPGLLNDKKLYIFGLLFFYEFVSGIIIRRPKNKSLMKVLFILLAIFFLSLCVQLINNYELQRGVEYFFISTTCALVAYRFIDERYTTCVINGINIVSKCFVIGTFINLIYPQFFGTFFPFLYGSGLEMVNSAQNGYYIGFAGEPSFNGYAMMITTIYSTLNYTTGKNKFYSGLWLILSVVGILLTGKRSFLLIAPVLVLTIIRMGNPKLRFPKTIVFFIVLFVITLILYTISPESFSFMSRMFNEDNTINLNYRDIIWGIAIGLFLSHPLVGVGINRFDVYFNQFYLAHFSYYEERYFAGAHNSYIQYLAEIGIIGSIIVIGIMILSFWKTRKIIIAKKLTISQQRILLFSIGVQLLTLIYALSGNPMHQYQQYMLYIIAIAMSYINLNKKVV